MKKRKRRLPLFAALVTVAASLTVVSGALAFDSGGNPKDYPGDNTVQWTGQGVKDGVLNTQECGDEADVPDGVDPDSYLHWIFTTDGGSAQNVELHLGGTGSGDYSVSGGGNSFSFYTPFFTLAGLTAYVDFDVVSTGSGAWNLVISHGCGGRETVNDLTATKDAAPSFTRTYNWTIDKSADAETVYSAGGEESGEVNYTIDVTKDAGTDSGWTVSGDINVLNSEDFDVTVDITDSIPGGTCSVTNGDDVLVSAGGSVSRSYSCTFASNPGSGTNTATVSWDETDVYEAGSTNATADFTFGDPSSIVNDSITVTDTNGGSWDFSDSGSATYSQTFTDPAGTCTSHVNTATIEETQQSDSVTVQDCQGADLTVSKTATPSFDRAYAWEIDKSADQTSIQLGGAGGTATVNYTVSVSHDAGTDSNWQVNGVITITNPNDWQDITLTDLTDVIDNGGTCTVDAGPYIVPKSDSLDVNYTCTYASAPSPAAFKNTATATWDAAAAHTPNGTASGDASGSFGDPTNVTDECIDVSDSLGGVLGTVCVGDDNPTTFTYALTFDAPDQGTCASHDNTATFTTNDTGTTGSDSWTVQICNFRASLTPGYWKTHLALNGTAGCTGLPSGTGCSSNGPFTITYLPQLLGSYNVDSILKAANVFAKMNCSNSGSQSAQNQNAIGCLAGHLLAAKLNVANGGNSCIGATIAAADTLLSGIPYTGPSGNYSGISLATRNQAIALKNQLDYYNNNSSCI